MFLALSLSLARISLKSTPIKAKSPTLRQAHNRILHSSSRPHQPHLSNRKRGRDRERESISGINKSAYVFLHLLICHAHPGQVLGPDIGRQRPSSGRKKFSNSTFH